MSHFESDVNQHSVPVLQIAFGLELSMLIINIFYVYLNEIKR